MNRRRATIIYNPTSGFVRDKAGYVQEMVDLLAERGVMAEARATSAASDASRFASEAVADGVDIVVSHGGDGTVNEVVQEMVGAESALAVWSGGTTNIVARELGLPGDKEDLAPIIGTGRTLRISLGRATFGTSDGNESICRYFVMVAGIGLDASVCLGVSPRLKRVGGKFAFGLTAAKHLVTWRPVSFDVTVDEKRRLEGAFALVANGASYGAPITMAPAARLSDPSFEVFVLPAHRHNLAYVRDFVGCRKSGPQATSGTSVSGRMVDVASKGRVWVELDGEVVGTLPARFEIVPDALSVIVP